MFQGRADLRFLPANGHSLKQSTHAGDQHRLAMLGLALRQCNWLVDERELFRDSVSRTVETLEAYRREQGDSRSIIFVMGQDAWNGFSRWYRWLDIPRLANIMVLKRPDAPDKTDGQGEGELHLKLADKPLALANASHGMLSFVTLTQLDISSSRIRSLVAGGHSPRFLVPDTVLDYIESHQLYRVTH